MISVKDDQKISNMTVGDLKELITETVHKALDPDYGLELRPEVEIELRESLKNPGKGISVDKVAEELGLKW